MAVFETILESDLKKPLKVEKLAGCFYSDDKSANRIIVVVTDNGAAASLSGTVRGSIIRDDNATLTVTGTLSGNRASITLPTNAYTVPGPLHIVIRLFTGSGDNQVKTVLGACTGYVWQTTTDTIVDPESVVPSIDDILALIDIMEDATEDCTAATAKVTGLTVGASTLAAGSSATATISTVSGHYNIAFGIPKGDTGEVSEAELATDTWLLRAGTTIASGSNLNNYKTPGNYRVENSTAAAGITNSPITNGGYVLKVYSNHDDYTILQLAIHGNGKVIYTRTYNSSSNAWQSWVYFTSQTATSSAAGLMSASDKTSHDQIVNTGLYGRLEYTGNDLDGLSTPGIYWIRSTTVTNNWPVGVSLSGTKYAIVEVLMYNQIMTLVMQRLTVYPNGNIYIRMLNGATWSTWKRYADEESYTYTDSLDDLRITGTYWCNSSVTTTGWPVSGSSNFGMLEVKNVSGATMQRMTIYKVANAPQVYERMYASNTTGWSAWATLA